MQSVPITTKVVGSNFNLGEVYNIKQTNKQNIYDETLDTHE